VSLVSGTAGSQLGFLGSLAQTKERPFSGARDTLVKMQEVVLGPHGEHSPLVRQFAEWVVRDRAPKDKHGEILAVRNIFVQDSPWRPGTPLFRYTNDPRHIEWVKRPERIVREISEHGTSLVDCDDMAAMAAALVLHLGREPEFVALGYNGQLTHVGLRVREPKSGRWIWIDTVAGPREREAAEKAQQRLFWSLD
jgi:hypothetical protein